jgi:hypothetical protein
VKLSWGKSKFRTGQGSTRLTWEEFPGRFKQHFDDPAFDVAKPEIEKRRAHLDESRDGNVGRSPWARLEH